MSSINKLRAIFSRRAKFQFIALLFGIITGAMLETVVLSLISPFVSVLLDNSAIANNFLLSFFYDLLGFRSAVGFLAFLALSLAFVYIFRGAYLFLLNMMKYRLMSSRQVELSARILDIILKKPYIFHVNYNLATLQRAVSADVSSLFGMISSVLSFLSDFFMASFMLSFLFLVSPFMTIMILFLSGICISVYFKFFRHKIREAGLINRIRSIAMIKSVQQSLGGIKELKILNREAFFLGAFRRESREYVLSNQRYQVYNSLPRLFIESVCFGGAFTIIGVMILLGTNLETMVPQLSVFVVAAFRILPAVSRLTGHINSIIFKRACLDSVYSYFTEKTSEDEPIRAPAPKPTENSMDIIIHDVTFRYPLSDKPVLENVSLRIPHKQSVAFVGTSGAGKTTLADVLLGIYRPESGAVFFNGYSIHDNREDWVKNVGYIPQQIYLLDDTITRNVAFGLPDKKIDLDSVWRALEQAQLHEFVRSLPNGLDTVVGDRGVRLSGGQRQRVGIARALYLNPSFLLLDEATSSLDTETEAAVMEAINSFQGTKTILVIAHRLSTIEKCGIIYRIKDGKAVRER